MFCAAAGGLLSRALFSRATVVLCGLIAAFPAAASASHVISSSGPLDSIYAGSGLECQVHYTGDTFAEFFGNRDPGACGTFVSVGGQVYGPAGLPAEGNFSTPFTPDAQFVDGSGTASSPYRVSTAVAVGDTGLNVTQTDTYVNGSDKYDSRLLITNTSSQPQTVVLSHGADCYLGDDDRGYGYIDATNGGIFCTKNANNSPAGRVEGFVPVEGSSQHLETHYSSNWRAIASGQPLPDTCDCTTYQDNGAAISWTVTIPAGGGQTRSWATVFSPVGVIHARNYVALGDSVAAGEGIGYGYEWDSAAHKWTQPFGAPGWDTDNQDENCHQTTSGYPHALADSLGAALTDLACTGASVPNGLFRTKDGQRQAQLGSDQYSDAEAPNSRYDDASPDVVTLTVGADDIDFASKVRACYTLSGWAGSCGESGDRAELASALTRQRNDLRRALTEIRNRGAAAGKIPIVAVTQYYSPFPARYPTDSGCVDINPARRLGITLTAAEMDYLEGGEAQLNAGIASVAREFRNAVVVPPPPAFSQHRWCTDDPWVYGPSIAVSHPTAMAPFHPTPAGQQAIADKVASVLADQRHVSIGNDIPVDFGNVHLLYAAVNMSGTAFVNTYNPQGGAPAPQLRSNQSPSAKRAAESALDAGAGADDSVPPARNFLPVHIYLAGSSAEYTNGLDITIPSEGGSDIYAVIDGTWQRVTSTSDGAGNLTAHLDALGLIAVGNPAPAVTAAIAPTSATVAAPADVTFDASPSHVDSGTISSYNWDFGDGDTGGGQTAQHRYTSAGTYTVSLTTVSDAGATDTATRDIAVTNAPPVAALSGPTNSVVGQPVMLDAAGSHDPNGQVVETHWDFGDGSDPSSDTTTQHTFTTPGTFHVAVTVLDDEGAQDTKTQTVTVTAPRNADVPPPPVVPTTPATVPAPPPAGLRPVVTQGQSAPTAQLRLLGAVKRGKHSTLSVRVRCLPGAACKGAVTFSVRVHGRSVTVARGTVHLASGQTKTLRLVVARKGRAYLSRRTLRLSAVATLAGSPRRSLGTVVLKR
jgi:PKD repeat protein